MALLSREQILNANDRTYEVVQCPEWGGDVRIQSLTGLEYDRFQKEIASGRGKNRDVRFDHLRTRLIVKCAVDEDGALMFEEADIRRLSSKNSKPIDRLFAACQKIVGMSDDDAEKMVEDFDIPQSDDTLSE